MVRIASVSTTHPSHRVEPEELRAYIRTCLPPASAGRFCRILDASQALRRHTIAPIADLLRLQSIEDRTRQFVQHSITMGERVARDALTGAGIEPTEITTLVSVSSTGYMAPSLDAHLVARLGLRPSVRRVPITQLGCSGGVSAIATATDLIKSVSGSALVVSVEICSLCLQSAEPSPMDLIASILFGDGAAATVLRTANPQQGPEIIGSRSALLSGSLDQVGIRPSTTGLRLVLSREMPAIVRRHLPELLTDFLKPYGLHPGDLAFWLVHPGGPRVLEAVEQVVPIPRTALTHSWEVWRECGNMSSATALFVLDRWLAAGSALEPERVGILLAFGPGVSCEMVLLRSGNASADSTC